MTEYNKFAKGRFTSTGGAATIYLPFRPDYIEIDNYSAALAAPAANAVVSAKWDSGMGQGFAIETVYNATPTLVADVVVANGISVFSANQGLQFGPTLQIVSISKANPAVVTTSTNHGLVTGDVVMLQGLVQAVGTGMQQIAGIPFTVTVTGATTFTIPYNTNQSNFTALAASPTGAFVKKVLWPTLYVPGVAFITGITLGTTTTVTTANPHNYVVGQEVAFRIPSQYGTVQLNSNPSGLIPSYPVYGYVISVTNANTFVVDIDSSAYTAFTNNVPFANVAAGLSFPQVVAVGDINTGGTQISAGSSLYPPQQYSLTGTTLINANGGPGIRGAFFANTGRGFIIGAGAGSTLTGSTLVGANGNIIYWRAWAADLNYPM